MNVHIQDLFSNEVLQNSFEKVVLPVTDDNITKTNSLFIDNILEEDLPIIKKYFSQQPGFNDMRSLRNSKDKTFVSFIIFVNDMFSTQAYNEFIRFKNRRDEGGDNDSEILKRYHINYTKLSTRKLRGSRASREFIRVRNLTHTTTTKSIKPLW